MGGCSWVIVVGCCLLLMVVVAEGSCGCLWVLMNGGGHPWTVMGTHGQWWVFMGDGGQPLLPFIDGCCCCCCCCWWWCWCCQFWCCCGCGWRKSHVIRCDIDVMLKLLHMQNMWSSVWLCFKQMLLPTCHENPSICIHSILPYFWNMGNLMGNMLKYYRTHILFLLCIILSRGTY